MPEPGVAMETLGFLTIGLFDGADPGERLESPIRFFVLTAIRKLRLAARPA